LIALQPPPILVGSLSTGHDEDRDGELSARAPDFRRAIPNVNHLVSRRLVSRSAEIRRPRELAH
jgi:hypothetical protein